MTLAERFTEIFEQLLLMIEAQLAGSIIPNRVGAPMLSFARNYLTRLNASIAAILARVAAGETAAPLPRPAAAPKRHIPAPTQPGRWQALRRWLPGWLGGGTTPAFPPAPSPHTPRAHARPHPRPRPRPRQATPAAAARHEPPSPPELPIAPMRAAAPKRTLAPRPHCAASPLRTDPQSSNVNNTAKNPQSDPAISHARFVTILQRSRQSGRD